MRKGILNPLAWLILCSSCKQSADKKAMITSLQYSLEEASRTIGFETQATLAKLEEKSATPAMASKAGIWLPKAQQAEQYKNKFIREVDRIANACKTDGSGCDEQDMATLKSMLKEYSDSSLHTDPLIKAEFARNFSDSIANGQSFSSILDRLKHHDHFSKEERAAIFAQLKLLAIQTTNRIIHFCNEQISDPGFYYTVYSAIVAQNSGVLLPGEQLEITAGVGVFSQRAQPKILINGKPCELREDATVKYHTKPKGKPGTYTIPVVLDFLDEDGEPRQIRKNVTYRLGP